MSVWVCSEAASSHDRDMAKAMRLIDVAKAAGADSVKFPYWSDADLLADRRHVGPEYRAIYHRYQLPFDWLVQLGEQAHSVGLQFVVSAYLPGDFAKVAPLADWLKVASFENEDWKLLREALATGQRVIVSAGMSDERHVERLLNWRWKRHVERELTHLEGCEGDLSPDQLPLGQQQQMFVLHCVNHYSGHVPPEALNLSVLRQSDEFPTENLDGYSDHEADPESGARAVLAGARMLEVHLRLDDTSPANPDYPPALSPAEFARYVALVRDAEVRLGDGVKRVMDVEREMSAYKVKA